MMIELLEIRNKEVHGKDEATKQQKRKAKTAISIQALHNLQEKDCPKNSYLLFYPDVEEDIEHTTATKLEGFIAIKTRPIHNSVSKWAN